MSEPFVGEIRLFAGNFAPNGWAFCNGQLLPISQNTALFSLLGTFYGGNGKTNFALPNLQGSVAVGAGQGEGLTERFVGESGGSSSITLLMSELPMHSHTPRAKTASSHESPEGAVWSKTAGRRGTPAYASVPGWPEVTMNMNAVGIAGGNLPHNNKQPYLGLNYIIALEGIFPPRS
ncbi:phage tail protein [Paenibacillus sedimenti]|uniref:Phage tail protein n=1 Tax=Paenibacillus sedimenti TaxID=2770274 RepID=A0A926QKN1_9BACL|nr:tail fiber protein [Paenibacillus sedimenti]MBD0381958.1 phage tail protein [Paenibacillus sedimenti]